jgi:hypothetical protein
MPPKRPNGPRPRAVRTPHPSPPTAVLRPRRAAPGRRRQAGRAPGTAGSGGTRGERHAVRAVPRRRSRARSGALAPGSTAAAAVRLARRGRPRGRPRRAAIARPTRPSPAPASDAQRSARLARHAAICRRACRGRPANPARKRGGTSGIGARGAAPAGLRRTAPDAAARTPRLVIAPRERAPATDTREAVPREGNGVVWLHGLHAVAAALANPRRRWPSPPHRRGRGGTGGAGAGRHPEARAVGAGGGPHALPQLPPEDAIHQGVALLAEPLPNVALDDALAASPGPCCCWTR